MFRTLRLQRREERLRKAALWCEGRAEGSWHWATVSAAKGGTAGMGHIKGRKVVSGAEEGVQVGVGRWMLGWWHGF